MKPKRRTAAREGFLVGLGILAMAAVLAWQTALIPPGAAYAQVGPRVAPWIVTAMLAVLGLGIAAEGLLGRRAPTAAHGEIDRRALAWLVGGLLLNIALIGFTGFIVASTVLFAVTARAFGSTRPLRDGAVGFALALTAHVGFDRLLGYRIGSGLIERFL